MKEHKCRRTIDRRQTGSVRGNDDDDCMRRHGTISNRPDRGPTMFMRGLTTLHDHRT